MLYTKYKYFQVNWNNEYIDTALEFETEFLGKTL